MNVPTFYTNDFLALLQLKTKMLPPTATQPPRGDDDEDDDVIPPSGQPAEIVCPGTSSSRASTPRNVESFSGISGIGGKMEQFIEVQNKLMQQIVRPSTDRMKEAFIEYIRECLYDMDPTIADDMQREIMRMALAYKDKDAELKSRHHRTPNPMPGPSAPATSSSSAAWQPPPHMWPSQVQNPVSVWNSMDSAWVSQQQFTHQQQQPAQQMENLPPPPRASRILSSTPIRPSLNSSAHEQNTSWPSGLSTFLRVMDDKDKDDAQKNVNVTEKDDNDEEQ